ncbi:MAG TPA: hypothetical protein VF146_20495 [Bryobacteraceae bacterium]
MQPTVSLDSSAAQPAPSRAAINRENSQRSTGPRTQDGKQRSSENSLKHGLTSRTPVLRSEDPAAYQRHCRGFHEEYQPKTPTEIQLVQELAGTAWRLNRIPALEAQLLDVAEREQRWNGRVPAGIAQAMRTLATLGLHGQRLSRQFNKTLTTLREIQAERRALAQQASARPQLSGHELDQHHSGFVFSNPQFEPDATRRTPLPAHAASAAHAATADPTPLY